MTTAEKLVMIDPNAVKRIKDVLSLFRNESHKEIVDILRAALHYVNTGSYFNFERTVADIDSTSKKSL